MQIKDFTFLFLFCLSFFESHSQTVKINHGWVSTTPFEHHLFIENKGQFTEEEKKNIDQPILFYNRLGKIQIYFSASCITFRHDSIAKINDEDNISQTKLKQPEQDKNLKAIPQFLKVTWQNANPDVEIEVQEPVKDYFTYGNPAEKLGHSGIVAHAWKKLIYHNLYKGIDVEFTFPEDKGGLEYSIIVHPGANLSKIKMTYSENTKITQLGNDISITSPCLNLIDHSPTAKDEKGNIVSASFSVNKNSFSFKAGNYDKTKSLKIDPWLTSTNFFIYNLAYDIDYDNRGNVYIAGGQPPYELQQYDSTGKLNWTYTTAFGGPPVWYGGFTTDVRSGTSYIVKGLAGYNPDANVLKVNNAGIQIAQDSDAAIGEMWRVAFDYINNQLVIAAGEDYQAAFMDTNLNGVKNIALIDTIPIDNQIAHDMSLLAVDNNGNAYMATNHSTQSFNNTEYNNVIYKLPLPLLLPMKYMFSDHYGFTEFLSMLYYPPQSNGGFDYANGFNGMAANRTMLVTYDGASLKKWRVSNGSLVDSAKVSITSFQWGGLDLDCAGNIYAGNNNSISIYDSNLSFLNSTPVSNTVYALKVNKRHLYACGYGFVQSINITGCSDTIHNDTIIGTNTRYEPCANFIVPNVFTPNGDKVNDVFEITTKNLDSWSILIYDRWGKEVFKSTNPTQYWDGTTGGSQVPDGVYYYIINSTCQGNTYKKDGFVQLIR